MFLLKDVHVSTITGSKFMFIAKVTKKILSELTTVSYRTLVKNCLSVLAVTCSLQCEFAYISYWNKAPILFS